MDSLEESISASGLGGYGDGGGTFRAVASAIVCAQSLEINSCTIVDSILSQPVKYWDCAGQIMSRRLGSRWKKRCDETTLLLLRSLRQTLEPKWLQLESEL